MIGNDVVDLGDPAIAGHHRRSRFVDRVCAPEEAARVRTKADLWSLFAAKEAAYKALVRLGRAPGFGHRAIVVAADLRSVRWGDVVLALHVDLDDDRAHAVAWTADGPRPFARAARAAGPLEDGARRLACALAAEAAGLEPSELAIARDPASGAWDGLGLPRVERRGAPLPVVVSLSHDGGFVAAAARVRSP